MTSEVIEAHAESLKDSDSHSQISNHSDASLNSHHSRFEGQFLLTSYFMYEPLWVIGSLLWFKPLTVQPNNISVPSDVSTPENGDSSTEQTTTETSSPKEQIKERSSTITKKIPLSEYATLQVKLRRNIEALNTVVRLSKQSVSQSVNPGSKFKRDLCITNTSLTRES